MKKHLLDLAAGFVVGLLVVLLSACVTAAEVTCHYVSGVGYVCDGNVSGTDR
jgi:hypothetical protein